MRWPFAVALVVVVLGVVGGIVVPLTVFEYHAHEWRRQQAVDERGAHNVAAVLAKLTLPSGVEQCEDAYETQLGLTYGMVCWRGTAKPVPTAIALRSDLIAVGATAVAAKCVDRPALGDACYITARVAGYAFDTSVGSQLQPTKDDKYAYQPYGVIVLGAGGPHTRIFPDLAKIGKPIPLP